MSTGAIAPAHLQPKSFAFTTENVELAKRIIAKYPEGRQQSAVLPLLYVAQRQEGWVPRAAMDHIADMLSVPRIRVYEVATFYTMFNKAPVGKHHLQVCTTTPCWLRNSDAVLKAILDKTGATPGHTSEDGLFTVSEVECLGACVNAPMMQVNDDYYEDLDYDRTCALIDALREGKTVPHGSQTGRHGSQAQAGPTSLLDRAPAEVRAQVEARTKE